MPYVSETIKIAGTKFDRRRKLTEDDKVEIRKMYQDSCSYAEIAKVFGVNRRTISFIVNPEELAWNKLLREKRGGWKQYHNKKEHTKRIKEYRSYKQSLYIQGLIEKGNFKSYKVLNKKGVKK